MTLCVRIAHGSKSYPALAHAISSTGAVTLEDGGPEKEAWVHAQKCAVIHELQPGETPQMAEERAVKRMWTAYAHQAGGKTFDGKPLPTWEELGAERQECWRAALRGL